MELASLPPQSAVSPIFYFIIFTSESCLQERRRPRPRRGEQISL